MNSVLRAVYTGCIAELIVMLAGVMGMAHDDCRWGSVVRLWETLHIPSRWLLRQLFNTVSDRPYDVRDFVVMFVTQAVAYALVALPLILLFRRSKQDSVARAVSGAKSPPMPRPGTGPSGSACVRPQRFGNTPSSGHADVGAEPPEKAGWWSRNRRWFVPVVGGLAALVLFSALAGLLLYAITRTMRSSGAYKDALAMARGSAAVVEALGEPVEEGFLVSGSVEISGSSGAAELAIPISGPKGRGTIHLQANRSAEQWSFSRLVVDVDTGKTSIDLLPKSPDLLQQFLMLSGLPPGLPGEELGMLPPSLPEQLGMPSPALPEQPGMLPPAVPADPGNPSRASTPGPAEGQPWAVPDLGMDLVWVAPGSFQMGSNDAYDSEKPAHTVKITRGFWLGKCEAMRGAFARFVESSGYRTDAEKVGKAVALTTDGRGQLQTGVNWRRPGFEQSDKHPVVCVTWNDAVAFCTWLTSQEEGAGRVPKGYEYRLPTEAEWEYSCRAGTATEYAWGDNADGGAGWCNGFDQSAAARFPRAGAPFFWKDGHVFTAPAGSFQANAWGLHDLHGNVQEWCLDGYDAGYYGRSPGTDPLNTQAADFPSRVDRGGSWDGPTPAILRSATRGYFQPDFACGTQGFRVCLAPIIVLPAK